ncbi:cupin domain-containing protein [Halobacteriaceae archaeon GCM10025711]
METVAIDDVEPDRFGAGVDRHVLSSPLGTTDVAINRFSVASGEELPAGLHAHADQEEVFVVLAGEATFETLVEGADGREAGEVTVGAGEAIRFAPGEFQSGRNDADTDLVVLAMGAPRDSEDVRIPVACPACGHEDVRLDAGGDRPTFVCPDCGDEHVPAPCPACGSEDLHTTLGADARVIVVCRECDAAFDEPPLRD